MKTVAIEQVKKIIKFELNCTEEKVHELTGSKTEWSVFDILALDIPAEGKLDIVLHVEFLSKMLLHEIACRYGEKVLSKIDNPPPCYSAAINTKREWLQGKISGRALDVARDAAEEAEWGAIMPITWGCVQSLVLCVTGFTAEEAARDGAWYASQVAWIACRSKTSNVPGDAAWDAARIEQVDILSELLNEEIC